MGTPSTTFDRTHSTRLDCIQWLLDHRPPWLVRLVLRRYKAALESRVQP